jgi:hypothetical protein
MGLTIFRTLASEAQRPEDARALVQKLRSRASSLPGVAIRGICCGAGQPFNDLP